MKQPPFLRHLFRSGQAGGFTQEQYRTVLFRGEPGKPFAIVCPGGGFSYVGAIHEGFPLAIALSEMGYNAFSIQYRTGGAQVACEDLAQAIDFIMRNAEELQVSTEDYSLWGGSAGARMAAYLGSYSTQGFINATHDRSAAVIMGYTGHSEYTQNDPPTYVIIGEDDAIASCDYAPTGGESSGVGNRCRISFASRFAPRLRIGNRNDRRRLGKGCRQVLGEIHFP